ncbi:MAG: hypothetical protein IVW54_11805 [Candidatus Binataceae bacterium]|nr:hypothetical protein [Candidatus Binataceae bacterium]
MGLSRLIFVTGKGGTGKSTLSAALAVALTRRHGRCALTDLGGQLSAARMIGLAGRPDLPNPPTFAGAPEVLAISRRTELEAFIKRIVPLTSISNRMLKSRTFGYVTAAVPGLEAFLLMERLRMMAGDAALKNYYVVADGPASGNAIEMLSVAAGLREMAPLGKLNRLASGVEELTADANRFGVVITATPEELAVREALECAHRLAQLRITRTIMLLNCAVAPLFTTPEIGRLRKLDGHRELAARRRELADRTDEARLKLKQTGLPLIESPMLFRTELQVDDIISLATELEGLLDLE